jgi:HPt (histidine-containing phosphotransfer) domain-containing protein
MTDVTGEEGKKMAVTIDKDLEDLIPGYIENRYGDIKSIRAALVTRDFDAIRVLGHSMKGSGGGYGFDAITDIGKTIEDAAKAGNSAAVSDAVERLLHYLGQVEVVYE